MQTSRLYGVSKDNGLGKFACTLRNKYQPHEAHILKGWLQELTVDIMPWELPVNRIFTFSLMWKQAVQGYIRVSWVNPFRINVTASRLGYPSIQTLQIPAALQPTQRGTTSSQPPAPAITVSKATTVAPNLIIPVDFELHIKNSVYGRVLHANLDRDPHLWKGLLWNFNDGTSVASTTTDSEGDMR